MTKLEPIIKNFLSKRDYDIDEIVLKLQQLTGVERKIIKRRIEKLIKRGKLSSCDGRMISQDLTPMNTVLSDIDEKYELGPITIIRKGREILVQSNIDQEQHKKMVVDFKKDLPNHKNQLEQILVEIEQLIIKHFNPLDALGHVATKNLTGDLEDYSESTFEGKQLIVEILQNIILKNGFELYPEYSNLDKLAELETLLEKLWDLMEWYPIYETISRDDLGTIEKDIYFKVVTDFLFIRGDAYQQHYEQIARELFSEIGHIIKNKGFTIDEYFNVIKEINNQSTPKFNDHLFRLGEEHERFKEFVRAYEEEGKDLSTLKGEYIKSLDERKETVQDLIDNVSKIGPKDDYEIILNDKINKPLLDSLSIEFGNNSHWASPINKSDVALKPLIKVNNKYYCFISQNLIRNAIPIIESFFDTQSEKTEYGEIKGNYFENKSLELIKTIIPNADIYKNLKYPKNAEIDGIAIYNNNLLLIEVKGKKRRCIACADDILRMTEEDVQEHVGKTFEQSKRAYDYIIGKSEVQFKDENKKTLVIKQKNFRNIFLINITAESFSEFTTDLNILNSWNPDLFQDDNYPWAVNIYDLLVISEILDNPDDFFEYLIERINLNKTHGIGALDELDFFGYYLSHGTLTKTTDIINAGSPLISGYSEAIDKYYLSAE